MADKAETIDIASAMPSDAEGAKAIAVDVLTVGDDPRISALLASLTRRGLDVRSLTSAAGSGTGALTLVVLLDNALESSIPESEVRKLGRHYRDIVPVSVTSAGASEYLAELSHTILADTTPDAAADLIASIVTVGGQRIVEWNRLVDRARGWADQPDAALLMNEADSSTAAIALADPPSFADEQSLDLTRRYVNASSVAVTRRRRRTIAVLSTIAFLLVVLLVLAITGTFTANDSRVRANDERNIAQADGLADLSMRLIDADPDLPSILIQQAAGIKTTERVLAAANTIETSTWPHRSVKVGATPEILTGASAAHRVAVVTSQPLQLLVFDTDTGHVVAQLHPHWPLEEKRSVVLSSDGTRVATKARGADVEILDLNGHAVTVPGSADLGSVLGWVDTNTLAVVRPDGLVAVPISGGPPQVLMSVTAGETVRGFARTPNGSAVAAITREALYLSHGTSPPTRVAIDGAMDVAISPSGDAVGVAAFPASRVFRLRPGSEPGFVVPRANATRVESTGADTFVFGTRDGDLVQAHSGDSSTLKVVHAQPGISLRLAAAGSGQLATTGSDGYLRVWSPGVSGMGTETPLMFGAPHDMREAVFAHSSATPTMRESSRNLISVASGGSRATAIAQPNYMWTVDVSTGKPVRTDRPMFFGGLDADTSLSPKGTAAAIVGAKRSSTGKLGPDGRLSKGSLFEGKSLLMSIAGTGDGLMAVSDDATTIAMADATHLNCWSTVTDSKVQNDKSFHEGRSVASVAARTKDGSARCVALTVDGYFRTQDGREERVDEELTQRIDDGSTQIAAAAIGSDGDSAIAVTDTGDVYTLSGRDAQRIGGVGEGLKPFAVRVSPSGKRLAVIGEGATVIVDVDSGTTIQRIVGRGDSFLSDVAFVDENKGQLIAITSLGAAQLITLDGRCGTALCGISSPRPLTDDERAAYSLDASSGGK